MAEGRYRPILEPNAEQAVRLAAYIRQMLAEAQRDPQARLPRTTTVSEACILFDVRLVTDATAGAIELLALFVARAMGESIPQVMDRLGSPSTTADGRSLDERARDLVGRRETMPIDRYGQHIDEFALTYATQGVETLIVMGSGLITALVNLGAAQDSEQVLANLKRVSEPLIRSQIQDAETPDERGR